MEKKKNQKSGKAFKVCLIKDVTARLLLVSIKGL